MLLGCGESSAAGAADRQGEALEGAQVGLAHLSPQLPYLATLCLYLCLSVRDAVMLVVGCSCQCASGEGGGAERVDRAQRDRPQGFIRRCEFYGCGGVCGGVLVCLAVCVSTDRCLQFSSRLVPYDKLSEQLVSLQAEFLAIDDALYYLERCSGNPMCVALIVR